LLPDPTRLSRPNTKLLINSCNCSSSIFFYTHRHESNTLVFNDLGKKIK
jgi:hypothetical protein